MNVGQLKALLATQNDTNEVQFVDCQTRTKTPISQVFRAPAPECAQGITYLTFDPYEQKAAELFGIDTTNVLIWHREVAKRYMLARKYGCNHAQAWEIAGTDTAGK